MQKTKKSSDMSKSAPLPRSRSQIRDVIKRHGLSLTTGEITLIEGNYYITHSGLLRIATHQHCQGIETSLVNNFCNPENSRWIFRAVVHPMDSRLGFTGYGDA